MLLIRKIPTLPTLPYLPYPTYSTLLTLPYLPYPYLPTLLTLHKRLSMCRAVFVFDLRLSTPLYGLPATVM